MDAVWEKQRVVVCVGTGGVGKTTLSAALGVAAASAGKKTLVMTIDPARRLAHALGLPDEGEAVRSIEPSMLEPYGVVLKAPLCIQMPQVKRTFDRLIERFAPDEGRKQAILQNRIYHYFSSALAGAHEYAAVERLYEAVSSENYDFLVLDTPPSQNVVDFLDAPGKIMDFLDHEMVQWWVKPSVKASRWSSKLFDMGGQIVGKTLGSIAGADTLKEIVDFVLGFQGMYEGFRERASAVRNMLGADTTSFVLATSAQANQYHACVHFVESLKSRGLDVRNIWLNRVRTLAPQLAQYAAQAWIEQTLQDPVHMQGCVDAWLAACAEAEHDAHVVDMFQKAFVQRHVTCFPELTTDAHDVQSLALLHTCFLKG